MRERGHRGPEDQLQEKKTQEEVEAIVRTWTLDQVVGTYVVLHRTEENIDPLDCNINKAEIDKVCKKILKENNFKLGWFW